MRILLISIFLLTFYSNKAIAQKSGEQINYNSEKGIYYVKYWSVSDSTFYTIPLFPGDKIEPTVKATVSVEKEIFTYEYSVSNKETSLREIYTFSVPLEANIQSLKNPNREWSGNIIQWAKMVRWVQSNSKSDTLGVLPGTEVDGKFLLRSENLPGITEARVSSFLGVGNSKDEGPTGELRVKIDSVLENSKHFEVKTIGPRKLPENIGNTALLDTLRSHLSFSCDTTWIANQGICNSLESKLDNVEKQLEQSNEKNAANNLQAFLNEVEALKEKQISSEAYALLHYNGTYLKEKLESRQ